MDEVQVDSANPIAQFEMILEETFVVKHYRDGITLGFSSQYFERNKDHILNLCEGLGWKVELGRPHPTLAYLNLMDETPNRDRYMSVTAYMIAGPKRKNKKVG